MPVLVENFHREEGFRKVMTTGVPRGFTTCAPASVKEMR
jgi:hypothetical protein